MKEKNLIKKGNIIFRNKKILLSDLQDFIYQLKIFKAKILKNKKEENLKYNLRDFLKNTFYKKNTINVKENFDLAIFSEKTNNLETIFETKIPDSREIISTENLQNKSMYQILLYFLQERIIHKNNNLKNLIITNFYKWFIFDASDFEKLFFENKELKNEFEEWNNNKKVSKKTDFFYKEIAKKYIEKFENQIKFTYFDIENLDTNLEKNQKFLVSLYKIFSPYSLLKRSFENDNNTLDRKFYNELLYIIGLEEVEVSGKVLIKRKKKKNYASLIENTISVIGMEEPSFYDIDIYEYGETKSEQIENIALELNILWVNRIIFLKLLEAQLISFHRKDKNYSFLEILKINDFDELNELFFEVLSRKEEKRISYLKEKFNFIPYLNSSLFEISNLEREVIKINSIKNRLKLILYKDSVLKNEKNSLPLLEYIFKFLNSFDFTNVKADEVQKEEKNLINASVLGLIFEKINGYKEGSFFTPSYITMYMSRETIRRAVLQKFTSLPKFKNLKNFDELKYEIEDRKEANKIINSLKICDPAVGSGHFLVSALNEIIAIKSELGIMEYRNKKRIMYYKAEVINDELVITDKETEEIFEYNLSEKNNPIDYKQELQEAIFYEKQYLIENCLFGVDINPNSVNICRLRIWIELLKNAFYNKESNYKSLEVLPNIDINIKKGNSLISCFSLNGSNIKKMALSTKKYKEQVFLYKSTTNRIAKRKIEKEINDLKKKFAKNVNSTDEDYKILKEKKDEMAKMPMIFTQEEKKFWIKKLKILTKEIENLEKIYKKKLKTIYEKAFEWRFEFPEVLDENGNFEGFDIVMGNPPYISAVDMSRNAQLKTYFKNNYDVVKGAYDIFILFLKKATQILKKDCFYSWIIPNRFLSAQYAELIKKELIKNGLIHSVDISNIKVFKKANVYPIIIVGKNGNNEENFTEYYIKKEKELNEGNHKKYEILKEYRSFKDLGIKIMSGATGFEAGKIKSVLSERKTKNSIPFIVSGCIDQYSVDFKNLRFMKKKFKKAFISNKLKKIAKTKWSFWNNKKIVIAGMTKKVEAIFAEEALAIGVGTYGIYDFANFEPKFILALLNSKFMSSYITKKFKDKHLAGGYLSINKNTIEQYPIVEIRKKEQQKFVKKVDKILELKNKKFDTSKLEKEIDILVYKLYNLTKEEIKIIENETI